MTRRAILAAVAPVLALFTGATAAHAQKLGASVDVPTERTGPAPSPAPKEPKPMPPTAPTAWEYAHGDSSPELLDSLLTHWGAEGWEAWHLTVRADCSTRGALFGLTLARVYFKRPLGAPAAKAQL